MADYARRRQAILEGRTIDAFLVVHLEGNDADRASMQYLCGYPGYGARLITPRATVALASRTNIGQAQGDAPDLPWEILDWDYPKAIAAVIDRCGVKHIGVASRRLGLYTARALQSLTTAEFVISDDPVAELRVIKDLDEVARIREATEITEQALDETLRAFRPGKSESELAVELEFSMRRLGAEGVAFELIVASGASSALPHHRPGPRPIGLGDALLFDIGARVDGYCSDITRTVFVGEPDPELLRVYDVVLAANRAGIDSLRPGRSGPDAERAARDVIERAGYGPHYTHGLSHGVGLEIHELPTSSGPHASGTYVPGMVVTAEPGVYLLGKGGVRIEDTVAITAEGPELLSRFPKDPPLVLA